MSGAGTGYGIEESGGAKIRLHEDGGSCAMLVSGDEWTLYDSSGRARIDLDPVFLETVLAIERNPLFVHDASRSGAGFHWRVLGKRRGHEEVRFPAAAGEVDQPGEDLR